MAYPDRIDFSQLNGKVVINKFERREGRDFPFDHDVREGFDLATALAWCRDKGYAVRQWERHDGIQAGARAWRGGAAWVIRTKGQIQRKRAKNPCAVNVDFAYDC